MGFVKNVINGFVGNTAADASREAAAVQAQSGADAIAFQRETRDLARTDLAPFTQFGQSNLSTLQSILTPQGQSDYLKNNPLFQIALDNVNRSSNNTFLGRGKLGDATGQLVNNAFLAGQPMLQQQTSNLFNAVNLGQSSAAGQANTALNTGNNVSDLLTGIGNSQASGLVGAGNAQTQGANNLAQTAALAALFFSDRRLKRNVRPADSYKGYLTYYYQYLWSDQWFRGVMADEVKSINPHAVIRHVSGYDLVNYGAL